ncbi:phosphate acyltransferase, partial [Staphylococcus epidermidis]|uniref:phosphate acyltransferase n=1 Tax=Staphylococcus epidermidis TaxID=1282 RepID=UPI0037D992F3
MHAQFQFHAAILPTLPHNKPPPPKIQPHPNLFLFPTLQPPNIPYNIPQPLPPYHPLPPLLQPLNSPVNHLSPPSSTQDLYNLS